MPSNAPFLIGRVKSVTVGPNLSDGVPDPNYDNPSDLGKITFEILYNSSVNVGSTTTRPAYPIFNFVRQYPLVSEIVLIVPGPTSKMNDDKAFQDFYYFPPYSIWNSVNHNAFPNMSEYQQFVKKFFESRGHNTQVDPNTTPKLPLGHTFIESSNVRMIPSFEGDTILESRFGQSIRMGSTVTRKKSENFWSNSGPDGMPITVIRNGQYIQGKVDPFSLSPENLDLDPSFVVLSSDQEILFGDFGDFPLTTLGFTKVSASNNFERLQEKPDTDTSITAANSQIL